MNVRAATDEIAGKRALSAEQLSQAIQNIPDYSKLDSTGFTRDLWKAFKKDIGNIWRKHTASSLTPR